MSVRLMSFVRRMSLKSDSNFQNLLNPALWKLKRIFDDHQKELRIAGGIKSRKRTNDSFLGAPRDLLLGKIPSDIDLATTATPEEMIEMLKKEKIDTINANGKWVDVFISTFGILN